jgi:general stress protein YciG
MQANTRNRGFASMDSQKQREIARKGGKAAHQKGTAHEFSADEARVAGRKGGEAVSANRNHMSHIGRIGGKSSAGRRRERAANKSSENSAGNRSENGSSQTESSSAVEPESDSSEAT